MGFDIKDFNKELHSKTQVLVNEYKKLLKEKEVLQKELDQYKTISKLDNIKPTNKKAIIFYAADVSGSMRTWEKQTGKSFADKVRVVLGKKYKSVTSAYFHHNTEAKEVNRGQFLNAALSGGTIASSVYRMMNKELEDYDYLREDTDVYVIHISDGDNLTSDNMRTVKTLEKLFNKVDMVVYFETNQYRRHSTLMSSFKRIQHDKFLYTSIESYESVDPFVAKLVEKIEDKDLEKINDIDEDFFD